MPAEAQTFNHAKALKQIDIPIDGGLVVPVELCNQFGNGQGSVVLQQPKQAQPRLGYEMPVLFQRPDK